MSKKILVVWMVLLALSAYGLFSIKYRVYDLKRDVAEIKRQLADEHNETYVLKAEWTYLNQPERLRVLAEKHLGLKPISVAQIQPLEYEGVMVALADGTTKMASKTSVLEDELASASIIQDDSMLPNIHPTFKPSQRSIKVQQ